MLSPPASAVSFTQDERNALTLCVGMTDNAFSIAARKLRGATEAQIKASYAAAPDRNLLLPMVEKIYNDLFTRSWDYAVSFYSECALNLGKVNAERAQMPGYCMQNSMIAASAWDGRRAGRSKQAVLGDFAGLKSDTPKTIVDGVYASTADRTHAVHSTWDDCMRPIYASHSR
jgi:hypothetical protein